MNKHRLQAEIWETQIWLMWILAFLMMHSGGLWAHIGAYCVLAHSGITFFGMVWKLKKARKEDPDF